MTAMKKPRRMARPPVAGDGADNEPATHVATALQSTKLGLVLTLLQQDGGVLLSALVEATGWQTHTVRAALTGLRKKGHTIERSRIDGETRYAVLPGAAG